MEVILELTVRHIGEALRGIRRSPKIATFAVLTISLGLGIATAVFAIVDSITTAPEYLTREDVVNVYRADPRVASLPAAAISFSQSEYSLLVESHVFDATSAWRFSRLPARLPGGRKLLNVELVDGEFFNLLNIQLAIGRPIVLSDTKDDAPPVIVISESFWRAQLNSNPEVLGRTLMIGSLEATIIGVTPREFRGVYAPAILSTDVWLPLSHDGARDRSEIDDSHSLLVKARLKTSVGLSAARAQVRVIGQQAIKSDEDRAGNEPVAAKTRWTAVPASEIYVHESVHVLTKPLVIGTFSALIVLLFVVFTNLASLLLSIGRGRRFDRTVRVSLGATRLRLMAPELIESLIIVAVGALGGMVVGTAVARIVVSKTWQIAPAISVSMSPHLNARVLIVGGMSASLAFALFGLLPAWHLSRLNLRDLLAAGQKGVSPSWRGRSLVLSAQIAIAFVFATLAWLSADRARYGAHHDPGFDVDALSVVRFDLDSKDHVSSVTPGAMLSALKKLVSLNPMIRGVALTQGLPVGLAANSMEVAPFAQAGTPRSGRHARAVVGSSELFAVLGLRLIAGAGFVAPHEGGDEEAGNEDSVVVSRTTAVSLFGTENAVGKVLSIQPQPRRGSPPPVPYSARIVGVASDTDVGRFGNSGGLLIYLPLINYGEGQFTVVARTDKPAEVSNELREAISQSNSDAVIIDAGALRELIDPTQEPLRVTALLAGYLAVAATGLALIGLYALLLLNLAARTGEIGIRLALGASTSRIRLMLLREGLAPVFVGMAVGLVASILLRMSLMVVFVGSPWTSFAEGATTLSIVVVLFALVACLRPAQRGANIDVISTLREL